MTFKGQDFAQSEGEIPITTEEEAWSALDPKERELLENTMYDDTSLKKLTWDKWSLNEKIFNIELRKNNTISSRGIPLNPDARTQSEEFLDSIRNLKIDMGYLGTYNTGKYLRWVPSVMNIVFSPTFTRTIGVIAAVSMLFTPFGYAIGAVAMVAGLATVGIDIYMSTRRYRQLNRTREENVLLTEIKKEVGELESTFTTLESTPALRAIAATMMPGHGIDPIKKSPTVLSAVGSTLIANYFNIVASWSLSILSLNAIAIAMCMLTTITGYSTTAAMNHQYFKRLVYLGNANSLMLAELGLEQGFERGTRNDYLSNHLNMMRCYNLAVNEVAKHPEASKADPDKEVIRKALLDAFERNLLLVPDAKKSPRPSFLQDSWMLITDGMSWKDNNKRFTPSFMENDVTKHHSKETFNAKYKASAGHEVNVKGIEQDGKALETHKTEIVEADIKKPSQLISHIQQLKNQENNEQQRQGP